MSDEISNTPTPTPTDSYAGEMIYKMAKDMNFVGLWSIIYGAITCIGIITAVIGIPYIIAGLRLRDAANYFKSYSAHAEYFTLEQAFRMQSEFYRYIKIVIIISLVFLALYIVGMIVFFAFLATNMDGLFDEFAKMSL
jgi:hypothetical protein